MSSYDKKNNTRYNTLFLNNVCITRICRLGGSCKSVDGDTFYVDFDRMRTNGSYVYYWQLSDFLEPINYGVLSDKVYNQGDCNMFRYKKLSKSYFKQPMGEGSGNLPFRLKP